MRYRYRIEPTPAQQTMLARVFGCCRVVFNDALRVRGEAYRAGIKLSDSEIQRRVITAGQDDRPSGLAGRGAQCGVGAVGQRLPPRLAQLLRLAHRETQGPQAGPAADEIPQGSPAVVSAHPQRIQPCGANGRLFVAKVGEVRVRWSRELPAQPSSVTIIREPDGHYYASFVVDVAASPLPAVEREAGVDVGIARLATIATSDGTRVDVANPKHLGRKLRKLRAVGAGEVPPAERISQQGQDAAQSGCRAQRGGACAAGLSPQAGFGVGSREPSDPRRGPQHRGHGQKPSARPGDLGCGVGPVRADHRRESRPLRAHRASGVAMVGVEQDLLGVRASARRTPATGAAVDLPGLPGGPRQRPQRRQSHSRRRAGGETKRLWSPCKTCNPLRQWALKQEAPQQRRKPPRESPRLHGRGARQDSGLRSRR